MAKRKKNGSFLGTLFGAIFMIPLFPVLIVISCAKDYKPMNSTGRKISRGKKKGWF